MPAGVSFASAMPCRESFASASSSRACAPAAAATARAVSRALRRSSSVHPSQAVLRTAKSIASPTARQSSSCV